MFVLCFVISCIILCNIIISLPEMFLSLALSICPSLYVPPLTGTVKGGTLFSSGDVQDTMRLLWD